jgi:hypothetical protein
MRDPLGDESGLDHGDEAQQDKRSEGCQCHHADAGQELAHVLSRAGRRASRDQSPRCEREPEHKGNGDEDLGQDHRHRRLGEFLPGRGEAGEDAHRQDQRTGSHHEVDQPGPDNQFQPHHERTKDEQESTEAADELKVGNKCGPVVGKRSQGIRGGEPHDLISRLVGGGNERRREADQRQGPDARDWQVHQYRPRRCRGISLDHSPNHGKEDHEQHHGR